MSMCPLWTLPVLRVTPTLSILATIRRRSVGEDDLHLFIMPLPRLWRRQTFLLRHQNR